MINVTLNNSMKIPNSSKSLFITFDYNYQIVDKIKSLPVRHWHFNIKSWEVPRESIQELIHMFGRESLNIDENIDLDFKENNEEILENDKSKVFARLLKELDSDIRDFTIQALNQVPDYFYEVPASSTGKYHPSYALGEGGLVRHTIAAGLIALDLYRNETVTGQFTEREQQLMLAAIILHDTFKSGVVKTRYTVTEHPLLAADFILKMDQNFISKDDVVLIAECISTHMGQWNMDYKTNQEILEKPKTEMQKFVHLCDYLASRKTIEINFNVE